MEGRIFLGFSVDWEAGCHGAAPHKDFSVTIFFVRVKPIFFFFQERKSRYNSFISHSDFLTSSLWYYIDAKIWYGKHRNSKG